MTVDYIQKFVNFFSDPKRIEKKKKESEAKGASAKPETAATKPNQKIDIFGLIDKIATADPNGAKSIFSTSLADLEKLDLSGDSIGDKIELSNKKANEKAEGKETDSASKDKHENLYKLLGELYNDEEFTSLIDKDGDKKISDEESKEFIKAISKKDGNGDDFSIKDLKLFFDEVKAGMDKKQTDAEAIAKAQQQAALEEKGLNGEPVRAPYSGVPGMGYNMGANGFGSGTQGAGGYNPYAPVAQPKSIETQKNEAQTKINNYTAELESIASGEHPEVKAAVEAEKKAKAELDKQLQNDANIDEQLKTEFSKVNDEISSLKSDLSKKDGEISKGESELTQGENKLSNLQSALSSLAQPTGKEEDKEKDAQIAARRTELENQIKEQEAKNQQIKTKLDADKAEKEKLEGELKEKELKRGEIEEELNEDASPETKAAITAHKEAQENVKKVKESAEQKVKENLKTSQAEFKDLDMQVESGKNRAAERSLSAEAKKVADNINARFKGNLAGKGEAIVEAAEKYGIDPALLAAIMASETGWGTSRAVNNRNNPGGLMNPKDGCRTLQQFATIEDGIDAMASLLQRRYISRGLDTPQEIGPVYCPVGAANDPYGTNRHWIGTVSRIYNEMLS